MRKFREKSMYDLTGVGGWCVFGGLRYVSRYGISFSTSLNGLPIRCLFI